MNGVVYYEIFDAKIGCTVDHLKLVLRSILKVFFTDNEATLP